MGKFLFQLIGTIITLVIIGFIGYAVFTRLFQYWEEKEPLDDVVAVDIANPAKNISAKISDLLIEHNITDKGKSGMYFYFRQHYNNLKNSTCYYMIRFFDEEGKQLKGKQYQDEDGYFAIIGKIVPDDNDFENIQRPFIAYDQFDVPNKGVVYFYCDVQLFVLDRKGKRVELAHSDPNRFHLSY